MKRIAIIGGGISGLSAAFALQKARQSGAQVQYVLFEAGARLGGVIHSEQIDGCLVEAGPDSFLTEKPWAAELCRELGLGGDLIGSNDAERKTYILLKGRLILIPDGLMFMVPTKLAPALLSPLFSWGTKLRMAREWFTKPETRPDESVSALVTRHYGTEMVDRLADPLLSGVYGGTAAGLSVRAVLPRFAQMEATHGSLGKGMLAARMKATGAAPRPLFTSLRGGMQQMVDALCRRLDPSAVRVNTPVKQMRRSTEGWTVTTHEPSDFDAAILAVSAPAAAQLLPETSKPLAAALVAIPYSSSVTVALAYDHNVRAALPTGFGFLVPRSEGKRLLAATFVHNKFPHRAPENRALIRCFLGGTTDETAIGLSEQEVVHIARDELRQILGVSAEPLFTRVYQWPKAMAQYNVGHLERLDHIERLRAELPCLALAGNSYRGIGVPDCVLSGQEAARQILNHLGAAMPATSRDIKG